MRPLDSGKDENESVLNSAHAWTGVFLAQEKRDSRRHFTKGFRKNIVVAEICYQLLEVLSLCDGERA